MKYFPFILISFIVITLVAITHGDKHDILKKKVINSITARKISKRFITYHDYDAEDEKHERKRRSGNLIIFGLPEEASGQGMKEKQDIENLLKILLPTRDIPEVSYHRIGSYSTSKSRPIRVALNDENLVTECIRNLELLKSNEQYEYVNIAFDRTRVQLAKYRQLKRELEARNFNGNKYRISFIDGEPTIVENMKS